MLSVVFIWITIRRIWLYGKPSQLFNPIAVVMIRYIHPYDRWRGTRSRSAEALSRRAKSATQSLLRHLPRHSVPPILVLRHLAHQRQRLQMPRDERALCAAETGGDLVCPEWALGDKCTDSRELLHGGQRPRGERGCGNGRSLGVRNRERQRGRSWREARDLILGAEPADHAATFFLDALVVQRNESLQYLLLLHRPRPPVRLGNQRIQLVVHVAQHTTRSDLVDRALLWCECFARAELLDDVVHACHRHTLVARDRGFAVSVEALGEGGDAGADRVLRGGAETERDRSRESC